MKKEEVAIFLGPSLRPDKAKEIFEIEYKSPAERGDIFESIRQNKKLICLIDGVFDQSCSVAHREIMKALKKDIKVIGASSMGALRASELENFGMIGIGKIYSWYNNGKIDSDDEVAVVFDPEKYRNLSEPLVNIRYNFERAIEKGVINEETFNNLIEIAKSLYYPNRDYKKIFDIAKERNLPIKNLKRFIEIKKIDLKKRDAIKAIKKVRQNIS